MRNAASSLRMSGMLAGSVVVATFLACVDNADTPMTPSVRREDSRQAGVVVLIDNNIPPEKLGKCPLDFTAVVTLSAPEDANGNTVVCKVQSEAEGIVIVDDNDS